MGRVTITLPDDVEKQLRDTIPYKHGAMSKWIAEAVKRRLEQDRRR